MACWSAGLKSVLTNCNLILVARQYKILRYSIIKRDNLSKSIFYFYLKYFFFTILDKDEIFFYILIDRDPIISSKLLTPITIHCKQPAQQNEFTVHQPQNVQIMTATSNRVQR